MCFSKTFAWVIDSLEYGSITHLLSPALVVKVSARRMLTTGRETEKPGAVAALTDQFSMRVSRQIVCACMLGWLAVCDSQAGWLKRRLYTGLPGSSITNLHGTNLLGQVVFPDSPAALDTLPVQPLTGPFTAETQVSFTNDFGSWTPGYLEPPQTGEYTFWIYADETAELWLTSDPAAAADESRKQLIARVPARTHRRDWDLFPEQRSEPIRLEQGKTYYLEVLHKDASGSDHFGIGWQRPDGLRERPMPTYYFQPKRDPADTTPARDPIVAPLHPRSGASLALYEGMEVIAFVNANVDQPAPYQWSKGGVPVSGATNSYFTFTASMADSGAAVAVTVGSAGTFQTTITVLDDTTAPKLLSAGLSAGNPNEVQVVFDEEVGPDSATNPANHGISGATITSAVLQPDGRTVLLKTSTLTAVTGAVTLTVNNVQDRATPPNTIAANSTATFFVTHGLIMYQTYYQSIGGDLPGLLNWLNSPTAQHHQADSVRYVSTASLEWDSNRDRFQARWIGYVTAPVSGDYSFGLAADSQGALFLATSEDAATKRQIAAVEEPTDQWSLTNQTQLSSPVRLGAGQRYYIEAAIRDSTGDDGLTVVWQRPDIPNPIPDDSLEASVEPYLIPAAYLSAYRTTGPVSITNDLPSEVTVVEGQPLHLSVGVLGADGTPPYFYQWYRDGVALSRANTHAYSLPRTPLAELNAAYQLVVSNSFSSATSTVPAIKVTPDVTPPTVAFPLAHKLNQTPTTVRLVFNEPVDEASAETATNYVLTAEGATIDVLTAVLEADGVTVTLTTAAQQAGKIHTVKISNVKDRAATPNTIAPDSTDYFWHGVTTGKFVQRDDGYVIMEAEDATRNLARAGTDNDQWLFLTEREGFSGSGYMSVPNGRGSGNPPRSGEAVNARGAVLEFDVEFRQAGEYTVWARGWVENLDDPGADDSVYFGLDGVRIADGSAAELRDFDSTVQWVWQSDRGTLPDPQSFTLDAPGPHTLCFWQEDDGFLFDKIVIEPGNRHSDSAAPPPATSNGYLGDEPTQGWVGAAPPAPPTIALTSPTNRQAFVAGASVTLTASVGGPTPCAKVEFFEGTHLIGAATTPPYELTLTNAAVGYYTFTARTTDILGSQARSSSPRVMVGAPPPLAVLVVADAQALDPSDGAFRDRLADLGFEVRPVSAVASAAGDADLAEVLITSSSVSSEDVAEKFRLVSVPVVNWEDDLDDDYLMTAALDHDEMTNQTQIIIVDPAHPIARGLTGAVTVASSPQRFAWGLPRAASASVVGTLTDGKPCLFGYDTGALMIDGITPAPARRVHLFLASTTYANLTAEGLQLIDQALSWAVNRELTVGVGGPPELVATTIENGQITITWRNGSLESTTSLTSPVAWEDLGTSGTFTEPSGSGTRFFRVKQ